MSEEATIKQQIILEDKVSPALDAMVKAITGASNAMNELIAAVSGFGKVAGETDISADMAKVSESVRGVASAYDEAAKSAKALAEASESVSNVKLPQAPTQPQSGQAAQAVQAAAPQPSAAAPSAVPAAAAVPPPVPAAAAAVAANGAGLAQNSNRGGIEASAAAASGRSFKAYVKQAFTAAVALAKVGMGKFGRTMVAAFSKVHDIASKAFQKMSAIFKKGFEIFGNIVKDGVKLVADAAKNFVSSNLSIDKIFAASDARSNSIAQLNQLSDEQRNGLSANEIRDYGVKYANRVGVSSAEFMNQSMQLMNSTGGAFSSIGEAMNYNELMQKQMKMAGVSSSAADSVSLQWRQGLTKGFGSQEVTSVLENAPVLAQRLADTMGIEMGELKDAASKGQITAEIAKKALFDNAEDINAKFEAMPKTWEQIGATIKNNALQALDPVLQKVSDLAQNPAIEKITETLTNGFRWFSDIAVSAIDTVLNGVSTIAPYVEQVVTPIVDIMFSVWDIVKGLFDDIGKLFTKDEEFARSASSVWGDFRSILAGLKPIVEGIVNAIAGGVKILAGVVKNVITLGENVRTHVHNIFSDDKMVRKQYDTDIFIEGAEQLGGGIKSAVKESAILIGETMSKTLEPVLDIPVYGPSTELFRQNKNDRIQAGMSPNKPLHVKTVGKTKIDPESIQLLKDLAQAEIINRVNNISPSINATFGDIHETADVDAMLDRLEQEVVSARGQNLMLQAGLQYAI